jgi:hypothetical protein
MSEIHEGCLVEWAGPDDHEQAVPAGIAPGLVFTADDVERKSWIVIFEGWTTEAYDGENLRVVGYDPDRDHFKDIPWS